MRTIQDLQPLTDIYELRRLVTKLSNTIFSIHGHDRLKLFDTVLALLIVKVYDGLMKPSHLNVYELLRQDDAVLQESFHSFYKWVLEHLHFTSTDFQPSIGAEALRIGLEILAPYSFRLTTDTQVDALGTFYQEIVSSTFRGSLGAYFTPKPVADFAVTICQPSEADNILDMCCGSGTFLMSARDFAAKNQGIRKGGPAVFGCDIQGRMVLVTLFNSLIRGVFEPSIIQGNALAINLDKWQSLDSRVPLEGFSIIVSNPPFAGFESSKYLPYSSPKQTRVNKIIPFIVKTVQLLRPGGKAVLVIPTSVLNGEAKQFTELRAWLSSTVEVTEIISLPRNAFSHTDTGIEGALLFFKRRYKGSTRSYVFFKMLENIGYDRRGRFLSGSDTRETLKLWKRRELSDGSWIETEELAQVDRWDPMWLKEYASDGIKVDETTHIPLTRLCNVVKKKLREGDIQPNSIYRYFEVGDADINTGKVLYTHAAKGEEVSRKIRLRVPVEEGDVLLPNHRDSLVAKTAMETGRSAVLVTGSLSGCITTNRFTVLKPLVDPKLLIFILNTQLVRSQLVLHARGSASFDVRDKVLDEVRIPRTLIEDEILQNEILTAIQNREHCQKQLDEANLRVRQLSAKLK